MKKVICIQCGEMVEYVTEEVNDSCVVKNEIVNYKKKIARCEHCHKEVWAAEIDEYNAIEPIQKYCENHGLVTIDQIKYLLNKYDIGEKPLSLLLNMGEVTITRYLKGQIPSKNYSDILLSLFDTGCFFKVLEENRENITDVAYNRVIKKFEQNMNLFINNLRIDDESYYFSESRYDYEYPQQKRGGVLCKKQLCNC